MAAPEPLSRAGQMRSLLDDLSQKLKDLPAERRDPIEGELQKIQVCYDEALAAGEAGYRDLAESINDGLFELDRDWRITYMNRRAAGTIGRSPAEMVGKNLWETFPQILGTVTERVYRRVMEQRQPLNFETTGVLTGRWYDIHVYPSPRGITVFWIDITERKQAEEEIRKAHQQAEWLARLPQENPNPVARTALDGTIVYHNRSATECFGPSFAVGNLLPGPLLLIVKVASGLGKPVARDVFIGDRYYSITVMPFPGEQYANLYALDITDRKQAEEALRASEDKFARAFRSSPIALAISTVEDGRILEINDSFAEMYEYTREEVLGHTSIELGIIRPENRREVVRQFREESGFRNAELEVYAKSGAVRHVLFSTEPIEIDGKTRMLSVIMDITRRKLAENFDRALIDIGQILHSTLDFEAVLARSLAAAAVALGSDTAAFSMRKDGRWRISGVYGFSEDILGMELDDDKERHGVLAIRTKKVVAVSDAFNDERFNREHLREWGIRSVLVMPVIVEDEAIGVMFFNYQKSIYDFKQPHIDFVTQLAASLSLALVNARLYESLEAEINERKLAEAVQVEAKTKIEVQRRLMDQREQERLAIARDLHDGPIQTLSSTTFHLHMVKEVFTDPLLLVELNQIGMDIKNTIHELREVLNELRPPALMHFGLARIIQLYTQDLRERFPEIDIALDVAEDGQILPDLTRLAFYRIYQEGMNNIVRHSGASKAWVIFKIEADRFLLELRDNGNGFELVPDFDQLTRSGHFGLVGMKERAEAVGGEFIISTEPGKGTSIVVQAPLLAPGDAWQRQAQQEVARVKPK